MFTPVRKCARALSVMVISPGAADPSSASAGEEIRELARSATAVRGTNEEQTGREGERIFMSRVPRAPAERREVARSLAEDRPPNQGRAARPLQRAPPPCPSNPALSTRLLSGRPLPQRPGTSARAHELVAPRP